MFIFYLINNLGEINSINRFPNKYTSVLSVVCCLISSVAVSLNLSAAAYSRFSLCLSVTLRLVHCIFLTYHLNWEKIWSVHMRSQTNLPWAVIWREYFQIHGRL